MARKCITLILLLIVGESLVWVFCPDDITYAALGMGALAVIVMALLTRREPLGASGGGVLYFSERQTAWQFGSRRPRRVKRVHATEMMWRRRTAPAQAKPQEAHCPGEDKILRLCRLLPGSPAAVFDALTRPEQLLQWWTAGQSCTPCVADVDLRVDGQWRLGMRFSGRPTAHVCTGVYRQIEPNRLIFTWSWETPAISTGTTVVSIELSEADDGQTRLDLSHRYFNEPKHLAGHCKGWEACLDSLEHFLSRAVQSAVA